MMPFKLSITIGAEALLLLFSAIYFAIYDSQEWQFVTPFLNVCIAMLLYAYVKKVKYSNFLMKKYCQVGILILSPYLIGKVLLRSVEFNTEFYLILCEFGVLLFLLHVIKQKDVIIWFNDRRPL